MTQSKANYLAEWLREEAERSLRSNPFTDDVLNFIAVNLPEAEEAFNSVMND